LGAAQERRFLAPPPAVIRPTLRRGSEETAVLAAVVLGMQASSNMSKA